MAGTKRFAWTTFVCSLRQASFLWAVGGLLLVLLSFGSVALHLGRVSILWELLTATSLKSLNGLAATLAPIGDRWRGATGLLSYLPILLWVLACLGFALFIVLGTLWLSRRGPIWLSSFGPLALIPAAGVAAFEGVRTGILLDHVLAGDATLSEHGAAAAQGAALFKAVFLALLFFGALRWLQRGRFSADALRAATQLRSWGQVEAREHREIRRSRANLGRSGEPEDWVGLAFSGGGIRSATFNLGIVQALGRKGLLRAVDYLSTVSGGGYLGGWLARWTRQVGGVEKVEADLSGANEPEELRFLRRYSNYLTPRVGIFTADTWTTVATYLRNTFLNLIILIGGLAALLLLPRLLVGFMEPGAATTWLQPVHANLSLLVAAALTLFAVWRFSQRIPEPAVRRRSKARRGLAVAPPAGQGQLLLQVVLPLGVAAVFATHWLFAGKSYFCAKILGDLCSKVGFGCGAEGNSSGWLCWVLLAALGYGAATLFSASSTREEGVHEAGGARIPWLGTVAALVAGAVAGFAFYRFGQVLGFYSSASKLVPEAASELAIKRAPEIWRALVFGPPIVIAIFTLAGVLHVGLAGRFWTDHQREWLGRAGGWLLIFGVAWLVALGLAVYGAPLLLAAGPFVKAALASGWIATTLGGLAAGRGLQQGGGESKLRSVFLNVGPYIFIAGLLALVSLGLDAGLTKITAFTSSARSEAITAVWQELNSETAAKPDAPVSASLAAQGRQDSGGEAWDIKMETALSIEAPRPGFTEVLQAKARLHRRLLLRQAQGIETLILFSLLLSVAFTVAHQVDINEFSMHSYYRNRLVRCYLGASNPGRKSAKTTADPFTGFDEDDDLELSKLWLQKNEQGFGGPYPVLNTALNLVHGDELAWQTRKAASLVLTPLFCGYEFPPSNGDGGSRGGFRVTREYGNRLPSWTKKSEEPEGRGISLGTAMAISGAAASPNMGFRTTPTLALLMTIFNVRLGWWVGNPAHESAWSFASPRFGLGYLIQELFGLTSSRSAFVYTSDGGHFENLGIYELVRRKCKYIIACDGEEDAKLRFTGLGNAVRRCRTDFGATIEIKVDGIRQGKAHWAVGKITYDDQSEGRLLYIKASLTQNRDEPEDVLEYRACNEAFPHQSTGDQFFDEDQFESYRALGQHIAEELFRSLAPGPVASWKDVFELLPQKARDEALQKLSSEAEGSTGEDV
jgi:hypothetical protein